MIALLERINHADGVEIEKILHTAIRRYRILFPQCDIFFLSLPKDDPEERKRTLEYILWLENACDA